MTISWLPKIWVINHFESRNEAIVVHTIFDKVSKKGLKIAFFPSYAAIFLELLNLMATSQIILECKTETGHFADDTYILYGSKKIYTILPSVNYVIVTACFDVFMKTRRVMLELSGKLSLFIL